MATDVGPLLASVRAERAEALVRALRLDRVRLEDLLVDRETELERLRRVVERQAAQLNELREKLRELEKRARDIDVETLIRSIASAVAAGEAGLYGRTITAARAEIRAGIQPAGNQTGFVLARPGVYETSALSTVAFELRPLPATPAHEELLAPLAVLVNALAALQRALDRDLPAAARARAEAALGQTTGLLGDPELGPATAAAKLRTLVRSLSELGQQVGVIRAPARELAKRHRELSEPARPDELGAFAAALGALADELDRLAT